MKTIPNDRYEEFCECYVFIGHIKEALKVNTPKEALVRVREMAQAGEPQ